MSYENDYTLFEEQKKLRVHLSLFLFRLKMILNRFTF